ncbi:type VII secretion protein EssA [Oceanobacillus arenosus]|uniref:Type VII secretion protein EssA n=1 Tax=Oceanobacillus arenosus TaxID=1229153 RepID=A0A3D8PK92_9BACI|nr:type VII secretion protein EssA [Oceanobacillus arenosus]RDW16464.1 type VII secretion protein EssA [Oceanobacillus arenosus]
MMKVKLRPVKVLFLLSIILLILVPYQASAEKESSGNGELRMKVDRITQDKDGRKQQMETELDKVFPALFAEETDMRIEEKEMEQEEALENVHQSLFTMEAANTNVTLSNIKQSLFTNEYTITAAQNTQDQEEKSSRLSNAFLITLIGIAIVLCAGIYMMMQKMLD